MDFRAQFEAEHPDVHILSAEQAGRVDLVMGALGWLGDEEQVTRCTSLRQGKSTVIRVELQELRGGWRTAVLKQVLPWATGHETSYLPEDRGRAELRFYRRVARIPEAAACMPRLLGGDEKRSLLLLEDFRGSTDLMTMGLYTGLELEARDGEALGAFLRALHGGTRGEADPALANTEVKALWHHQLFEVPYGMGPDGLGGRPYDPEAEKGYCAVYAPDLKVLDEVESGLGEVAGAFRTDPAVRRAVFHLGERYLEDGPSLVHGDYYPANWLFTGGQGYRILDPQACCWGDGEFDIGVGLAHLLLARQPAEVLAAFLAAATGGGSEDVSDERPAADVLAGTTAWDAEVTTSRSTGADRELIAGYAGIELVKFLIGHLAANLKLPIRAYGGYRFKLLDIARTAILDRRMEILET